MICVRLAIKSLVLLAHSTLLYAQPDPSDRADSIMRERIDLFDIQPDTSGEYSIPPDRPIPPARWSPEFDARYGRRDQLSLRDRQFFITYDRADGLRLTAGADMPMSLLTDQRMQGYVSVGYALGSHYWQASGGVRRDFFDSEQPLSVAVEGHLTTDTRDAWKMDVIENSLAALIAGADARDYFKRAGFSVSIEQFIEPRTSVSVAFKRDSYSNSKREVGWSIFGPEQPFREVPSVREGTLQSIAATFQSDYVTLRSWTDPEYGFAAHAEIGSSADRNAVASTQNVDESFQSYIVDARLKAMLVERLIGVAFHMRFAASTGNAPPQRTFSIGGAGTVPGYPQNEYWGDRLAVIQSEVVVQPARTGFLRHLRVIVSQDFAGVSVAGKSERDNPFSILELPISEWKFSPGVYLGSPAAHFRIGIAWRTDVAATPRFVLRISETF